ncbi:MAG: threonine synthase [Candidatus Altiarchaeota archaeon]
MSDTIMFHSTNRKSEKVSFRDALLTGQAPDKGLYMPEKIPKIPLDEILSLKGKQYSEIAFEVMRRFLASDVSDSKLREITKDAYDFEVPLEKVEGRQYLMWLDEGPTLAFKDFAARIMARLMQHFLAEDNGPPLNILTATSGDTGGAVAAAFQGMKGINVFVLFPREEVSERQRKQMTTLGGNVSAIAVDGKFDDCQALVKQAFADSELKDLNLSSANSINFGRLLPQSVYYFYAFSQLFEEAGEKVVFSVPSGNFGDLMGGLIAKKMGLPVSKFVVATNENDEFTKFVEEGRYDKIVPSRNCLSTAMNVGHPSNLARLFDLYGGWMDETGKIHEMPDIEKIRGDMFAVSISNEETKKTITECFDTRGIILEPHGAVAWAGLKAYNKEVAEKPFAVSLETADPAKFPETLLELGIDPPIPESLKAVLSKEEKYEELPNDYESFKKYLKEKICP